MAQSKHSTTDVKKAAQQAQQYNFIDMHVEQTEKEPRAGVGTEE